MEYTNVEEFVEMGYAGEISDDAKGSDSDLTSCEGSETDEDENGRRLPGNSKNGRKFRQFHKETDMRNPVFEIGMKFASAEILRNAIKEYSIVNMRKI